jgi:OFA family oxalate/formate antiporter-like MFS transporter
MTHDGGDVRRHHRPRAQRPDRPFFGWISDMIGRENTMFIAFGMEGIGIWGLYMLGHDPVWFVLLSASCSLPGVRSTPSSRRPARIRSAAKFATTNAGLLYTQRAPRRLLVPIANYMQQSSGTWDAVFIVAAGANILASLLAIALLNPGARGGRQSQIAA